MNTDRLKGGTFHFMLRIYHIKVLIMAIIGILALGGFFVVVVNRMPVIADEPTPTITFPSTASGSDEGTQPTTTPFFSNGGPFITFPLTCPAKMTLSEGPTWRGITVGKSSLNELEEVYGVIFTTPPYQVYKGSFASSFYVMLTYRAAQERRIAQWAEACVVDGKIATLALSIGDDENLPSSWIYDWISRYGVPKIVTWSPDGWEWRDLLWPKQGFGLRVDVQSLAQDSRAALAQAVVFFPFDVNNNLSGWPYSGLLTEPPTSQNPDKLPTTKNPFNFNAILGTTTPFPLKAVMHFKSAKMDK